MPILAPAIAWLIPGAGHIIQKRWIRGALLFISITTLFVLGLLELRRLRSVGAGGTAVTTGTGSARGAA